MKSFKHEHLFYLHLYTASDYVLNLRYRPHCSKYKDLYYTPQHKKFCLLVSDEEML